VQPPPRAVDLSRLPPTLLTVGAFDGLCDEGVGFAQRLNHAGVSTELHLYPVPRTCSPVWRPEQRCPRDAGRTSKVGSFASSTV